jgi:hypothetical protein
MSAALRASIAHGAFWLLLVGGWLHPYTASARTAWGTARALKASWATEPRRSMTAWYRTTAAQGALVCRAVVDPVQAARTQRAEQHIRVAPVGGTGRIAEV